MTDMDNAAPIDVDDADKCKLPTNSTSFSSSRSTLSGFLKMWTVDKAGGGCFVDTLVLNE